MDKDQIMTEEQKTKFSALFLDKFGIKIDTDNEMLPLYFIGYHSALINDENSKVAHQNLQKIILKFEKSQEERNWLQEERSKQLDTQHENRVKYLEDYQSKMEKNSQDMDRIVKNFDKQMSDKLSQFKAKQYHFTGSGQAFWFSFGRVGLPIVIAILLLFLGLMLYVDQLTGDTVPLKEKVGQSIVQPESASIE